MATEINRISKFANVPNDFPRLAEAMLYEFQKHGIPTEEAQRRVLGAMVDAFNAIIAPDPNRESAKEFVIVISHNTAKDPLVRFTHTCGIASNRATDHAAAYGFISALCQYWATKLITEHVNKADQERAFTDFYQHIQLHVDQFREHERQEKLGEEEKTGSPE